MSVQRRSFFALKCSSGYMAEVPPVPGLSLCGGADFTLGATFMYPHAADDNILYSQDGVFTLGVKNGAVYFNAKNLGNFHTDSSGEPALKEDEWNRVDIVFGNGKLQIYVQGLLSEEFDAAGEAYVDETTRCRVGAMDGYLQELTLYSRAFTPEEILHLPFTHTETQDNTEMYLDFDAFTPFDRGRHAFPIQLKGRCDTVNLVYAFAPGQSGFALPYGSGQINPGGQSLAEFTILAAVFPMELDNAKQRETVIFSNGTKGGAQSLALGVDSATQLPYFEIGGSRFTYTSALENYTWYQLSVTVRDTEVKLFIDGKNDGFGTLAAPFVRTDPPEIMLGNQMKDDQAGYSFCGYIDQIAVFSQALPTERLIGYSNIEPYRFEDDLAALWLLAEPYPAELVSGGVLTYAADAGCILCENTVLDREPPQLQFNLPDISAVEDKVTEWETRLAAEAFTQGIKFLTGMNVDGGFVDPDHKTLNGSVEQLLSETIVSSDRLSDLYTEGKISGEDLGELFGAFTLGSCLGALCYAFYCSASNDGFRRAMLLRRFLHYLKLAPSISNWPVVGGVLADGAVIVAKYFESQPAPDAGECETEEYDVTFQSISFYHEESCDAGALFALPDFGEEAELPEWQRCGENVRSSPVLYHRSAPKEKIPSIILKFHCELKKPIPLSITFAAHCINGEGIDNVLGAPEEVSIEITKTGDYSITMPLSGHLLKTAELKAYNICWNWSVWAACSGKRIIGTTNHTINVIAATPLSPWTVEKDSSFPPVYPVIDFCNKVAEQKSDETDKDRRFASQFVTWAQNGGITAAPWNEKSRYAAWGMDDNRMLCFDICKCIEALKNGQTQLGDMDCACLHYMLTRLEGMNKLRILQLFPMHECNGLMLRKHRRTGAQSDDSYALIEKYHVCGIPDEDGGYRPQIWDGFLTFYDADEKAVTAKGISFCEKDPQQDMIVGPDSERYRTLLCSPGGTCEVGATVEIILPEALPPTQIVSGDPVLASITGRDSFDKRLKNTMPSVPSKRRCHSISFKSMETAIVAMVNALANGEVSKEKFLEGLLALWRAVTLRDNGSADLNDFHKIALQIIYELAETEDFSQKDMLVSKADRLLYNLNNSIENLRYGRSDWNSSVGQSYDPGSLGLCNRTVKIGGHTVAIIVSISVE